MDKNINRIVVYDFDGTICKSPENTDYNKKLWELKTGEKWPRDSKGNYRKGWWGKPETLDPDVFDIELVDFVKENAIKDIIDNNTLAVLMTGRRENCANNIKTILKRNNIPSFDVYLFNDMKSTQDFKVKHMLELLDEYKSVKEFVLWEDREEHINEWDGDTPPFKKVGGDWSELTGGKFTLNIITKDFKLKK